MKREVTWAMAMRPKQSGAKERILKELKRLRKDPPTGISAGPRGDDLYHWDAVVFGLYESAWSGGTFKLSLDFTVDYPHKPPKVRFVCPMFHPNIYADGRICGDILQRLNWRPVYDVESILISIQCLLCNPNPDCFPENSVAAQLYLEDQREYNRRVSRVVEQSWTSD